MAGKTDTKKPAKPSKKRSRKESKHRSFRISPRKFLERPVKISSSWRLLRDSFSFIFSNKKLFLGLALLFTFIQFSIVVFFGAGIDLDSAKQQIRELLGGEASPYRVAYGLTSYLFVSVQQRNNEIIGVYQNFVTVIFMLATIWTIRQKTAGEKIRFSDMFYKSQYPFLQFLVIIFILGLSLIPLMIAGFFYGTTIVQGIAVSVIEQALWVFLCGLLVLLSIYIIIPGLLALYIVTLPEVSPSSAYRSAWRLLENRRFAVGLRIVAGYIFVFIFTGIIITILSYLLTPFSELIFYIVSFFSILVLNIYTYKIYRELL